MRQLCAKHKIALFLSFYGKEFMEKHFPLNTKAKKGLQRKLTKGRGKSKWWSCLKSSLGKTKGGEISRIEKNEGGRLNHSNLNNHFYQDEGQWKAACEAYVREEKAQVREKSCASLAVVDLVMMIEGVWSSTILFGEEIKGQLGNTFYGGGRGQK